MRQFIDRPIALGNLYCSSNIYSIAKSIALLFRIFFYENRKTRLVSNIDMSVVATLFWPGICKITHCEKPAPFPCQHTQSTSERRLHSAIANFLNAIYFKMRKIKMHF